MRHMELKRLSRPQWRLPCPFPMKSPHIITCTHVDWSAQLSRRPVVYCYGRRVPLHASCNLGANCTETVPVSWQAGLGCNFAHNAP